MRNSNTIAAELQQKRDESRMLGRTIRTLEDELEEAKVNEAKADPHPWLGKKVKQVRPASNWRKGAGTKTVRGVLEIYGPGKYYRGGDSIQRGDLIVVTSSGLSAYRFNTRDGEQPWELDE